MHTCSSRLPFFFLETEWCNMRELETEEVIILGLQHLLHSDSIYFEGELPHLIMHAKRFWTPELVSFIPPVKDNYMIKGRTHLVCKISISDEATFLLRYPVASFSIWVTLITFLWDIPCFHLPMHDQILFWVLFPGGPQGTLRCSSAVGQTVCLGGTVRLGSPKLQFPTSGWVS